MTNMIIMNKNCPIINFQLVNIFKLFKTRSKVEYELKIMIFKECQVQVEDSRQVSTISVWRRSAGNLNQTWPMISDQTMDLAEKRK